MSEADTKKAVLAALFDATGRGDWTAVQACLADDVVISEADALPFAGAYHGKNALRDLYEKVMAMMDVEKLDLIQITTGGDYAIVLIDLIIKAPVRTRAQVAEVYRFRDGLICEIKPFYYDAAPVVAAVEAKLGG